MAILKKMFKSLIGRNKKGKAVKKTAKKNTKKTSKRAVKKVRNVAAKRKASKKMKRVNPRKVSKVLSAGPKEKQIGIVTHYFGKISVGIIKLKTGIKVGDSIHVQGAHDDFLQTIDSMQINHADVEQAKKGDEIGIKVRQRVHEHDKVYLAA